jgi:hypothetical protein
VVVGRYKNKLLVFNRKILLRKIALRGASHIVCLFSFICGIVLFCEVCPYLNKEPAVFHGTF